MLLLAGLHCVLLNTGYIPLDSGYLEVLQVSGNHIHASANALYDFIPSIVEWLDISKYGVSESGEITVYLIGYPR